MKKTAAKKPTAKKAAVKKAATAKSATTPKAPAKQSAAQKAPAKTAAGKAAKPVAKKAAAKKSTARKTSAAPATNPNRPASAQPSSTRSPGTARRATGSMDRPPSRSPSSNQVTSKVKKSASSASKAETLIHGFTPYTPNQGEEYMNEAQRAHFRQILLAWRQELMEEADRTMHHLQDEVANLPDPADRATQEEEFALELRTRDRERKLLKKIEKALDQIDKDDYGFCDACGIEIGIRRLEARPTAELCIDCKELAEIKEKQLAG